MKLCEEPCVYAGILGAGSEKPFFGRRTAPLRSPSSALFAALQDVGDHSEIMGDRRLCTRHVL
jgi:hypothetical protein